jgi:hypothetical protein
MQDGPESEPVGGEIGSSSRNSPVPWFSINTNAGDKAGPVTVVVRMPNVLIIDSRAGTSWWHQT